ncbi:hypothetical protein DTO021D3_3781 [Paecilomyces variotii]|nr:hypothetical protein DTO032I3_5512 [Paecilomyces variotii]KAJ9279325.1 hypothetical protein DTO021D3_3781 [Paecilomyces variotii]KAJ9341085.1 hypothetical protein DTO027B6_6357 [Paecilomyces variotii]KAJ9350668.1 hypothetical protein DTO027B9_6861 [Paecilomyces variotii]KAJ9385744.1 hypothetical protein DTO032I4_4085 [Paecilomyces variotii]
MMEKPDLQQEIVPTVSHAPCLASWCFDFRHRHSLLAINPNPIDPSLCAVSGQYGKLDYYYRLLDVLR